MVDFPATRWSLIARLPDDPLQASALVGLYADAIGGYLAAKLHGEDADRIADVVQEVLLDLLNRPTALGQARPGPGSRYRHFLMHLAWQSALNRLRHHRRRDGQSLDQPSMDLSAPDDPPAPEVQAMDRSWALSVVQQALAGMHQAAEQGTIDRDSVVVLEAHLIDGRNLRDIAAKTGWSLATCSRRLAQARQFVQRAIAERLRLVGEIGADESDQVAGARLLESLSIPR